MSRAGAAEAGRVVMADDSQNAGWSIFGYLISGMVFYGGLGWLIGHWTHLAAAVPDGHAGRAGSGSVRRHLQVRTAVTAAQSQQPFATPRRSPANPALDREPTVTLT